MTEQKKVFSLEWAGRQLVVETGQYAKQAAIYHSSNQRYQLQQLQKIQEV